jgi:PleD family two-component response regulator
MRPRILVIDGHPVYIHKLEGFLRGLTYKNIFVSHSGKEGLASAAAENIDLVILSGALQDMDSLTVCQKLKGADDRIRIIVQVGLLTDQEGMVRFKESGADVVLYRQEKDMTPLQNSIEDLLRSLEPEFQE